MRASDGKTLARVLQEVQNRAGFGSLRVLQAARDTTTTTSGRIQLTQAPGNLGRDAAQRRGCKEGSPQKRPLPRGASAMADPSDGEEIVEDTTGLIVETHEGRFEVGPLLRRGATGVVHRGR